jgi:hypothetical protein
MSDKRPIVDIGVACAANQSPAWWSPMTGGLLHEEKTGIIQINAIIAISSALEDYNKNNTIERYSSSPRRMKKTDVNRNKVVEDFMSGPAEWLFFMDDDTVFQRGTITKLVEKRRDFIAGIYFMPGVDRPHNPIAYQRSKEGYYRPVVDYPDGALFQVDSVGMGCTLIHRSVFEKIRDSHELFVRANGSFTPVLKKRILNKKPYKGTIKKPFVKDGILHTPVFSQEPEDDRGFPYFAMEYCRTEDHHFCELAEDVGIKPWLDTTLDCQHIKMLPTTLKDYKESLRKGEFNDEGA